MCDRGTDSIYIDQRGRYLLTPKYLVSIAELRFYALKHLAHVPLTPPGTQLHSFCHSWLAALGWQDFQIWDRKLLLHDPPFRSPSGTCRRTSFPSTHGTPVKFSLTQQRADQPLRPRFVCVSVHGHSIHLLPAGRTHRLSECVHSLLTWAWIVWTWLNSSFLDIA